MPTNLSASDQSILNAGTQIASTAINAISTANTNANYRDIANSIYAKERKDALEDWYRTNEYNSPEQQMRRLRQAGLNPNLVYGSGAATTEAKVMNNPSYQKPQQVAPQIDLSGIGESINMYNNIKTQQLQQQNLQQQIELGEKQKALLDQKITDTMFSALNKERDVSMKDLNIDIRKETSEALKQMPYAQLENYRVERKLKYEDIGIKKMYRNYQEEILKSQLAVQKANMDKTVMETTFLDKSFNDRLLNITANNYNKNIATDLLKWKRDTEGERIKEIKEKIKGIQNTNRISEKDADYYELDGITNAIIRLLGVTGTKGRRSR